jgi:class 3 adenylate cyclase
MEPSEREVVLIIADISGYTRFMVSNQQTLQHAQVIITELIQVIIRQVEIPLEIAKLEGDAVFLYALKDQSQTAWDSVRRQIGEKLIGFFEAFAAKIRELDQSNLCPCTACQHIDQLRLKAIVHSGQALFYTIGSFQELSGVDVILVHRLLKNTVASDQYILMTESAYRDVAFPQQIRVTEGHEVYGNIGRVKTYTYYPPAQELLGPELQAGRRYDSWWPQTKNALIKRLRPKLFQLGLVRVREFGHLPIPDGEP